MKKRFRNCVIAALSLCAFSLSSLTAFAESTGYSFITDMDGENVPIPQAYEVSKTIKNLGKSELLGNNMFLNQAEDLFIDSNDILYIADTGNNRVIKMTKNGEIQAVITEVCGKALSSPKGVFVYTDGSIWIADTGNNRIAVTTPSGKSVKEYGKPTGIPDEANVTYDIEKLFVDHMGYIYALKGSYIMKIDSDNEFQGYMGAKEVGFSFERFIVKTFGTKEQEKKLETVEPTAYNNFLLVNNNIYGVLAEGTTGQIRRLNSVGDNTYPENAYGYSYMEDGIVKEPSLIDIAVTQDGIVNVVDKNSGLVSQYDTNGNLLANFGGNGDRKGSFKNPTSIAVDSQGNIYVLDGSLKNIQIFESTDFIDKIHEAITLQEAGDYEGSMAKWTEVYNIDSNYFLANKSIGKLYFKETMVGDKNMKERVDLYKKSMAKYKLAADKEGFSESYSERRHEFFRKYFFWIVIVIVAVVIVIGKLFVYIKQKADKWSFNIEMGGDL